MNDMASLADQVELLLHRQGPPWESPASRWVFGMKS